MIFHLLRPMLRLLCL